MSLSQPTRVASPCIKFCQLNADQTCLGCGRTLQEIACWSHCDAARRSAIVAKADQRLQQLQTTEPMQPFDVALTI